MQDEALERQRRAARVLSVAGIYGLIGVLPVVLVGLGMAGRLVADTQLATGDKLVPSFDNGSIAAGIGLAVSLVLAPVVTAVVAGWLLESTAVKWAVGIAVALVHAGVVCAGLGFTGVGAATVFGGEKLAGRAWSPDREQRAFLYRSDSGSCGWAVYTADKLEPVSHLNAATPCLCDQMPPAVVVWTHLDPHLEDPGGQPYSCPPPPSTCDHGGVGAGWLAVGLALVLTRRRRRCVSDPDVLGDARQPSSTVLPASQ